MNKVRGYRVKRIVFLVVLSVFSMLLMSSVVSADDYDAAMQYAPVFYFEGEEECFPVDASYHLDNSDYGCIDSGIEESCYYDNIHGTIDDDGVINHYQSVMNSYGYTVYYYVNNSGGSTVIQYWMFYAFNEGELNQHEGDWELVQVVISSGGSKWVAYSQHYSGQRATWDQVERDGDHIKVYVARGSHANYLRSYSGKLGMSNDIVGDNGKVLKPASYTLESLEGKSWLSFSGRWGEIGEDVDDLSEIAASAVFGQIGPQGPMFREDLSGNRMWDGVSWGSSLPEASDTMFLAEWFIYNFVLIFVLITVLSLALIFFFIYRRHKKYGLGPRIISMLYIDGLNLKSIGNILCFVGIIVIILGLLNPWYSVSYEISEISGVSGLEALETSGMQELLMVDGINGVQMIFPTPNGAMPMGTVVIPFSLILGIGLIFLVVGTIGIYHSKKLGWKYLWRGIRFLIPFILLIIVLFAIGGIVGDAMGDTGGDGGDLPFDDIINSISGSPFGGEETFNIAVEEEDVSISVPLKMSWGLGLGAQLLIFGGIILIVAGVMEMLANTQFFVTKTPVGAPKMPAQPTATMPPAKTGKKAKKKSKSKTSSCPECGAKIEGEDDLFCPECGSKLK